MIDFGRTLTKFNFSYRWIPFIIEAIAKFDFYCDKIFNQSLSSILAVTK